MIQVRDIQRVLAYFNYYEGALDNDFGQKTRDACYQAVFDLGEKFVRQNPDWQHWPEKRLAVAALQLCLAQDNPDVGRIDGYAGMMTKHALATFDYKRVHGKDQEPNRPDEKQPPFAPALPDPAEPTLWPGGTELTKHYGVAGGPQCTAGVVKLPFPMRIAWNTEQSITQFKCHEKIADSAQRVFDRVADHYSMSQINALGLDLYGGCFNLRKKRGGTTLSNHSWGIAIDIDPERNQLRWGRERATFARPMYQMWWKLWEEENWTSLGRRFDFDWMHVEAVRY